MGCAQSQEVQPLDSDVGSTHSSAPTTEEIRVSRAIDRMLREDEKRRAREVKVLLLGPGSAGKTTVLKQMRVLHKLGFTSVELELYRYHVFTNIVQTVRTVLQAMEDDWHMQLETVEAERNIRLFFEPWPDILSSDQYPVSMLDPLKAIWSDPSFQRALSRGNEIALPDNLPHFFGDLDRLWQPGYTPTEQDIFLVRAKSIGISETVFKSGEMTYRMFDVGGQRSERRKWIACFEGVTALLFIASLSGYDEVLVEDRDSNTMRESLLLFESLVNARWFASTATILFLNKTDVFKQRLVTSPITRYFPDYDGDLADYNAARAYFQKRFTRLNRSPSKEVYVHFTCAIDTNALRVVMASVTDVILSRNMSELLL